MTEETAREWWAALGGAPELVGRIAVDRAPTVLDRAALPAAGLARAAVAVCAL
ncbi:hypothetical protein G3I34_28270, partial [Streptomyces sp. SID8014]|nr:hypothetical protein [Streptomyces sp. SID8014]